MYAWIFYWNSINLILYCFVWREKIPICQTEWTKLLKYHILPPADAVTDKKCCLLLYINIRISWFVSDTFTGAESILAVRIVCFYEHFLQQRWRSWNCSWVIILYHWLSQGMMRHEFVWPTQGSTKGWIQSRAPRGQAGGRPSWTAPASHHLHTAARPVSLDIPPPPLCPSPSPATSPSSPFHHP